LTHLFDADLQYDDAMLPVAQLQNAGELVGSGTGQVTGPRLQGTLRWSNFEQSEPDYCLLTLTGEISTDDGAVIQFNSRGFALPQSGALWKVASGVRFVVEDARYHWLQAAPAICEGEFDAATGSARYRTYVAATGGA
jgi:hypothetical protein